MRARFNPLPHWPGYCKVVNMIVLQIFVGVVVTYGVYKLLEWLNEEVDDGQW